MFVYTNIQFFCVNNYIIARKYYLSKFKINNKSQKMIISRNVYYLCGGLIWDQTDNMAIKIILNNQPHTVESLSLTELISELKIETKGVALAINNRVIPRANWNSTAIADGDSIVIVSAVFGG